MESTTQAQESFRFLDLSTELRLEIYKYLLVVGKIYFLPSDYEHSNELRYKNREGYLIPELQLLRVCKQVRAEAEKVYLSRNLFVLPHRLIHLPDGYDRGFNRDVLDVLGKHAPAHLENISIAIDPYQSSLPVLHTRQKWEADQQIHELEEGLFHEDLWTSMTPQERLAYKHRAGVVAAHHNWLSARKFLLR